MIMIPMAQTKLYSKRCELLASCFMIVLIKKYWIVLNNISTPIRTWQAIQNSPASLKMSSGIFDIVHVSTQSSFLSRLIWM